MGDGHVKIEDVSFFVLKVKVDLFVQLDHLKSLERMTAKYPVCRVETTVFSVPKGSRMANQENMFLGQSPKWFVIGMTDNKAFNGDKMKNPYDFQDLDVDYLALHVDGNQVLSKPLTPDFDNGLATRSYASFFTDTGFMGHNRGNQTSCEKNAKGFTLAFDLTADLNDGGHFQLVKEGNLWLELHFKTPLPDTINVIVYTKFDNVIEGDKAQNVVFNYSAWIVNSCLPFWSRMLLQLWCSMVSIPSTLFLLSAIATLSSIQLQTLTLDFTGWLSLSTITLLNTLTVMEEILPLHCCDGARKYNG